jgi:hypothetical protein
MRIEHSSIAAPGSLVYQHKSLRSPRVLVDITCRGTRDGFTGCAAGVRPGSLPRALHIFNGLATGFFYRLPFILNTPLP